MNRMTVVRAIAEITTKKKENDEEKDLLLEQQARPSWLRKPNLHRQHQEITRFHRHGDVLT